VNTRASVCFQLSLRARNNKDVFVARRMPVDVIDLLMKISLHAPASRRIELSEVADLHWIADLRFAICDFAAVFFDDAIIATISPASISKGLTFAALSKCVSIINSSQNALSSASSSTTPSLATNSGFERALQAAR